jgi:hypothetical protein
MVQPINAAKITIANQQRENAYMNHLLRALR